MPDQPGGNRNRHPTAGDPPGHKAKANPFFRPGYAVRSFPTAAIFVARYGPLAFTFDPGNTITTDTAAGRCPL